MRELLKTRKYKAGYELRYERLSGEDAASGSDFTMTSAYTPNGNYIGNSKRAHRLIVKYGIKPELGGMNDNVCSIGFSDRDKKWYGWSHRALHGFGIGDVVEEGDCAASTGYIDEYIAEHLEADLSLPVGFKAQNLEDAKRMAIAFAESVG